jgi:hypothetical protein
MPHDQTEVDHGQIREQRLERGRATASAARHLRFRTLATHAVQELVDQALADLGADDEGVQSRNRHKG